MATEENETTTTITKLKYAAVNSFYSVDRFVSFELSASYLQLKWNERGKKMNFWRNGVGDIYTFAHNMYVIRSLGSYTGLVCIYFSVPNNNGLWVYTECTVFISVVW